MIRMKFNKIFMGLGIAAALGLSACSLDRTPLDPNTNTTFNQDEVYSKVYATFGTTGQKGPDGSGDVDGIDEGTSGFYRMFWSLNEFPTDEVWWIWSTDAGVADILPMTWSKSNTFVAGIYYRFYFDITLCNHFLDMTEELNDEKTLRQRAEVRMIRAINYYFVLDMFNGGPMPMHVSPDKPAYATRAEMFAWLEEECKELEGLLPEQRASKYRVDRGAAQFILMRMYLNAAVYLGTPGTPNYDLARWNDAAIYADKLIQNPAYELYDVPAAERNDDHVYYSAYQQLFMGDNDQTAAKEAILLIYQDAQYCQSWAGARFVVNAPRDADFVPSGSSDSWTCVRSCPEFITNVWVSKEVAQDIKLNEYQMPVRLQDDRAIFCSVSTQGKAFSLSGGTASDLYASWGMPKFTGIYSTSTDPWNWTSPVGIADWVDTDIPLFRIAEAYMTYAECMQRGAAVPAGARYSNMLDPINALRRRAHAAELTSCSYTQLLSEWAKEFWGEGRRRTDLIRFEQFAGDKASMSWEGHNGKFDGRFCVFPIPESDETANPNLANVNAMIGY